MQNRTMVWLPALIIDTTEQGAKALVFSSNTAGVSELSKSLRGNAAIARAVGLNCPYMATCFKSVFDVDDHHLKFGFLLLNIGNYTNN